MDYNKFNGFEDFMNMFNSSRTGQNQEGCEDIPGGFQDLDPHLFTLLAQVIGLALSDRLPFNVQNAIGNWLTLVGQVIETYNAQQQYMQAGPGRYYNIKNKNVTNPFCTEESSQESSSNGDNNQYSSDIKKLKEEIARLSREVENLKSQMKNSQD